MSKEIKWYKRTDYTKEELIKEGAPTAIYYYKGYDDNCGSIQYTERIDVKGKFEYKYSVCIANESEPIDILEIQDYLPANHPDRIVGLPEEYIVECEDFVQLNKVFEEVYGYNNSNYITKEYKILQVDNFTLKQPVGEKGMAYWINIPSSNKLPVFTYEQWLKLKYMKEEFKVPERWCVKLDENNIDTFRKYNNTDWRESKGFIHSSKVGYNKWNETIVKGYTEITFEQFCKYILNNNTKTMERKIKGAFCIKDFPNNRFGVHKENYEGLDFLYDTESWRNYTPERYPEYWKIVYEEEFKVGDIVVVTEQYRSNSAHVNQIVRLTRMDLDNSIKYECEDYFNLYNWSIRSSWCLNVRLATPEEIKSVQTKTIVVGDKRIKFVISKGKIEADNTVFTIEDWKDVRRAMTTHANLRKYSVNFTSVKVGCTTIPLEDVDLIINTYNSLNE